MVSKYFAVFPIDLTGLPPDHDIDIESDTQPISIPPYWMGPAGFKKQKKQPRELLSKNFIRTSVSMWAALARFVKKKDGYL